MGFLRAIIGAKVASKAVDYISKRSRATADYIPSGTAVRSTAGSAASQLRTRGTVLADRATAIARQNPKLVTAGAGVLAVVLASVLAARKRP